MQFPQMVMPSVLRRAVKRILSGQGYDLRRMPRPLLDHSDMELHPEFAHLISHCVQNCDDFTFAQFGAFDGLQSDPIHEFVTRYHWRGLLVEPQPQWFHALRMNYQDQPQLVFENVAVADCEGVRPFFQIRGGDPSMPAGIEQLGSFDLRVILKHAGGVPRISEFVETIQVRCMTPHALFAKAGLNRVDLLQIDTEGYDFEILKLIDFQSVAPRLIHYEHAHLSNVDHEACLRLLISRGYRLYVGTTDTIAYRPL